MKVVISGGTGFVGQFLTRKLIEYDYEVAVLTRGMNLPKNDLLQKVSLIRCEPTKPGHWQKKVAEYDVVINLAGASIFNRWSPEAKRNIIDSRIRVTNNLVESIFYREQKEVQFFSASGIGYYGFHEDEILDESCPPGDDFLATLAVQWESAALRARQAGARVVICRLGHVLGKSGGVLPKLLTIAEWHLGSRWGNGKQWISWIHEADLADSLVFLLDQKNISGPVNITAPNSVRNRDLMNTLAQLLGKKPFIPLVPAFILKLIMGEFATVFLNGQRVMPKNLLDSGFNFKYPVLSRALNDIMLLHGKT